jgi:hypothetical protein
VALGQVFSKNFGFPCQPSFHQLLHNHLHYHPRLAQKARSGRSANSLTNQIKKKKYNRGGPGSNPGLVMWDFVMDKSGAGAGFLQELWFPLPTYVPSASPQSSSLSPEAATKGQEWLQHQ